MILLWYAALIISAFSVGFVLGAAWKAFWDMQEERPYDPCRTCPSITFIKEMNKGDKNYG